MLCLSLRAYRVYRDEKQGAHRDTNRRGMTEREVRMRGKKERERVFITDGRTVGWMRKKRK